jgi:hypothetical protein
MNRVLEKQDMIEMERMQSWRIVRKSDMRKMCDWRGMSIQQVQRKKSRSI